MVINAQFKERIDLLQSRREQLKYLETKTKTVYVDLNGLSKQQVIDILQDSNVSDEISFDEEYLIYDKLLVKEEIDIIEKEIKNGIKADIQQLNVWANMSEGDRSQLVEYLDFYGIEVEGITNK